MSGGKHELNRSDSASLRDRIAEVIDREVDGLWEPLDVADAIIAELNMKPETSYGTTYPNMPIEDRRLTRYVTDWKADDE